MIIINYWGLQVLFTDGLEFDNFNIYIFVNLFLIVVTLSLFIYLFFMFDVIWGKKHHIYACSCLIPALLMSDSRAKLLLKLKQAVWVNCEFFTKRHIWSLSAAELKWEIESIICALLSLPQFVAFCPDSVRDFLQNEKEFGSVVNLCGAGLTRSSNEDLITTQHKWNHESNPE